MPYVPWMQNLTYMWNMKATQAWEQSVRDGTANALQSRLFEPKGWTEELYDMQNDPDNVNNLIDQPQHQQTIATMREQLKAEQLRVHDSGLLPETERVRLASKNNTTIYEMVRDPAVYDLPALLAASDLALAKDPSNLPELHKLLDHADVGMRYWGIVGCFLLNDQQAGQKVIADPSHEVRAMAAWLLLRTGNREQGLACLTDLIENRSYALVSVLNVVDWIGEDARALAPAVQRQEFKETFPKQFKYEIRMKDTVLQRFGESAE